MKVYILTYQVPFNSVVEKVAEFTNDAAGDKAALAFINAASAAWWQAHGGERDNEADPYEPAEHFNYALAEIQLWGGENSFTAACDAADMPGIIERFYTAQYGARENWPGYMLNALGDDTTAETKAVFDYYGPRH